MTIPLDELINYWADKQHNSGYGFRDLEFVVETRIALEIFRDHLTIEVLQDLITLGLKSTEGNVPHGNIPPKNREQG